MSESTPSPASAFAPAVLRVKLHTDTASLPCRQSASAAGYDLRSDERVSILPGERRVIATNISLELPPGTYGRIAPRSGLAVKNGIDVLAGVIDADFRGLVGVVLINHSSNAFAINVEDRIAQLVIEKIATPEVAKIEGHTATERGDGGFGSTGI